MKVSECRNSTAHSETAFKARQGRGCITNAQKGIHTMTGLILSGKVTADRIERAMRIYESNLVRSIGKGTYVVRSESGEAYYIVNSTGCNCPDAIDRRMICKHTWACFMGAVLTVWRIQLATTANEAEQIAASYSTAGPVGIIRTIQLKRDLAISRLAN
jgi:hypothetical protein